MGVSIPRRPAQKRFPLKVIVHVGTFDTREEAIAIGEQVESAFYSLLKTEKFWKYSGAERARLTGGRGRIR